MRCSGGDSSSEVLGRKRAKATLKGDRGRVLDIEFYQETLAPNPYRLRGVVGDPSGRVYKVM